MTRLVVYRSRALLRAQRWHWRLIHANGNELCRSSEGYRDKDEATRMGVAVTSGKHKPEQIID